MTACMVAGRVFGISDFGAQIAAPALADDDIMEYDEARRDRRRGGSGISPQAN